MTGTSNITSDFKKQRIKQLTLAGYDNSVISERLGLRLQRIYYFQKKFGLRKHKENV